MQKTILASMYQINNEDPPSELPDTISFIKTFTKIIQLSSKPIQEDFLTFVYTPNDWYDYFENCFKEIKDCTDIIYNNAGDIPEDFISATNKVQKSNFEQLLKNYRNLEYNKEIEDKYNLHLVAPFMYNYLTDLKKLSEYKLK